MAEPGPDEIPRDFCFPGAAGQPLSGTLDVPQGTPRGYALFAHCFTCTKSSLAAARVARGLSKRGIGVLRFDFTGLGGSDGDFADTGFSTNVDDLIAAAAAMDEKGIAPGLLIGHSLGGSAALTAAKALPSIVAVATIGAPYDVDHVRALFGDRVAEVEEKGEAEVRIGENLFTVRRAFLDDLAAHDPKEAIGRLRRPLLILHSPDDDVVGLDNAASIYAAAAHPKSFVAIDGADHLLTDPRDASFAAELIAAWAGRYLGARSG